MDEVKEKEWEEFQKEIKEIDKRANCTGVNIINKIIYVKKEKGGKIKDE